jgi:hypothetical protein
MEYKDEEKEIVLNIFKILNNYSEKVKSVDLNWVERTLFGRSYIYIYINVESTKDTYYSTLTERLNACFDSEKNGYNDISDKAKEIEKTEAFKIERMLDSITHQNIHFNITETPKTIRLSYDWIAYLLNDVCTNKKIIFTSKSFDYFDACKLETEYKHLLK